MPEQARTLVELFLQRVARTPHDVALRYLHQGEECGQTWEQLASNVQRAVGGLLAVGVQPGDRVAHLAENRFEWIVTDLAILLSQAVHVPIHAPLAAEQVQYQINHSGARVLIVSGAEQQAKVAAVEANLSDDLTFVAYDRTGDGLAGRPLHDFQSWLRRETSAETTAAAERSRAETTPECLATILYTSGTTGQPKGVMLTHGNLVTNARSASEVFGVLDDDVRLCFLPLSHIFARTCDLYTWIAGGNQLCLATSRDTVVADCQWAKPTLMSGVPYFFDRVYRGLREHGMDKEPGALRNLLGGRIKFFGSGGAALPNHVFDAYVEQGVPILQGYGLTESSPVITASSPTAYRRGSAGRAVADVEVAIADDGEILTRGPHVMSGYWRDEAATTEVLVDGWLQTGDFGHLDEDGYIFITGRKKELIVTAAGKNVAPVLLESLLTEDPLIDQALVIGDGRNYLTALIVAHWDAVQAALPKLADELSVTDLSQLEDVRDLFQHQIEVRLACVSYHEQVRKFTLLTREFSIERHEMTPKLSLRRSVIHDHFQEEIDAMYRK